jgi:hypothetical protein
MNQPDLHGIEKQPFPNFGEDATYLEAVTLPKVSQAAELLQGEGFDTEAENLAAIHMRYSVGPDATEASHGEMDECWLECPADHPHAVAFWKDGP